MMTHDPSRALAGQCPEFDTPLVFVAVLGCGIVGRAEAAPPAVAQPTHLDLENDINSVQADVSNVQSTVNAIQTNVDQIPPAWSQTLPAAQRFVSVLGGQAELDKETGLVWGKSPETTPIDWFAAHRNCNGRSLGARKGWRLPTLQELASLVDTTQSSPALPAGHPFTNVSVAPAGYCSATTDAAGAGLAWGVVFSTGSVFHGQTKTGDLFVWCVRSGHHGLDVQ